MRWERSYTRLRFRLTQRVPPARRSAPCRSPRFRTTDGWAVNTIDTIRVEQEGYEVVVDLDQAPGLPDRARDREGHRTRALYGRDPLVPFAGVEGGPPGGVHDGHDAVVTFSPSAPTPYGKAGA